jgi:hypothetical protein
MDNDNEFAVSQEQPGLFDFNQDNDIHATPIFSVPPMGLTLNGFPSVELEEEEKAKDTHNSVHS